MLVVVKPNMYKQLWRCSPQQLGGHLINVIPMLPGEYWWCVGGAGLARCLSSVLPAGRSGGGRKIVKEDVTGLLRQ